MTIPFLEVDGLRLLQSGFDSEEQARDASIELPCSTSVVIRDYDVVITATDPKTNRVTGWDKKEGGYSTWVPQHDDVFSWANQF